MYSVLGGDLASIQDHSELEQLQAKPEEVVHRGRGRPKKYALNHVSLNVAHKKLRRFEEEGQSQAMKLKRRQLYSYWYGLVDVGSATIVGTTRRRRMTLSGRRSGE